MDKRLKILFLANRVPYPPFRGDKLKIYNLARRLKENHELHLVTFAQSKKDLSYRKELEEIFETVNLIHLPKWRSWWGAALAIFKKTPFQVAYFSLPTMHRGLKWFLANHEIDVVHVQHMRMAQYLSDKQDIKRILDLPDAYSLYWKRRKEVERPWWNRLFDSIESARVIAYEKVTSTFNLNLTCSVEDLAHLEKVHPNVPFKLLRNGVDLDLFKYQERDYAGAKTLLFTGNMDYAPNVDAVVHFAQNMFPQILQKAPQTKLIIAGQRPVKAVKELATEQIEVTGFVQDLSVMYAQSDVVIAPLRFGAGTQNKVLEALAMGVPVVCTHIGFEGLEIQSGQGAIYAKNDLEFIDAVIQLLNNQELRKTTGQAGLEIARNRFSWDIISKDLEKYLLELSAN
jgi:sugar transferase (PEP-CTERM/EpsH1 system associated)